MFHARFIDLGPTGVQFVCTGMRRQWPARGHHIFGREIVDLVLERSRKMAHNCIARRVVLVRNPFGRSSGLWSRVLATGLYGCRLRDEVACAVVW